MITIAQIFASGALVVASSLGLAIPLGVAQLGGRAPAKGALLDVGTGLSAGLLIAVGLLHFLAEALKSPHASNIVECLVMVGIVGGATLRTALVHYSGGARHAHDNGSISGDVQNATALLLLMSVHALLEGFAMAVTKSATASWALGTSLFVHRIFDGFVVGVGVVRSLRDTEGPTTSRSLCVAGGWLLTLPVGLVVGSMLQKGVDLEGLLCGFFVFTAVMELANSNLTILVGTAIGCFIGVNAV